ncbi:hypothetical protein DCAR_0624617 [Daucus carota subsp. sativus]|uniref:Uncharacterized protein n=1 Tax=Daucus carota subsp. sativus TaxID=79200 RepID=A0AAF0XC56_DAUCS|nr:hypothetical protein DCAR_0624617 [Daucus carota subsp. sativus]
MYNPNSENQAKQFEAMENPQNQSNEWEVMAKAWLSTLPEDKTISPDEIQAWLQSNQAHLPDHIKSMAPPQLHQRLASIHSAILQPRQENDVNYDHRFQRTDQWLPVYTWLESIKDTEEVVTSKDVLDWLSANPAVRDDLQSKHSRGHLMHYIKQCHLKILKRRKTLFPLVPSLQHSIVSIPKSYKKEKKFWLLNSSCFLILYLVNSAGNMMNKLPTDSDLYIAKRSEALHKYEMYVNINILCRITFNTIHLVI